MKLTKQQLQPPTFTRRDLVRSAAATAFGAGLIAGRRPIGTAGAQTDDPTKTLTLLCWGGYDDPEISKGFRDQTGIEVVAEYLGANDEIFTRLRAGGVGRVDLVTPQNGIVRTLAEVGLIQPLDLTRLPNAAGYLDRFQQPEWATFDGGVYAAPFLWGSSPMAYRFDQIEEPPQTWRDVQLATYSGKVVMSDDGIGHFKTWNRVMGFPDPMRVTTEQLTETTELLIEIKEIQAVAFTPSMVELAGVLGRGEAWISTVGWESIPVLPEAKRAPIAITHPGPGDHTFCDAFCLVADAPNPDAAYAFIDDMLSPQAQATAMRKMARGTVNADAISLLDEASRALYPYDALDSFFEINPLLGFPPLEDAGDGIAIYTDWVNAWERVRYAPLSTEQD